MDQTMEKDVFSDRKENERKSSLLSAEERMWEAERKFKETNMNIARKIDNLLAYMAFSLNCETLMPYFDDENPFLLEKLHDQTD